MPKIGVKLSCIDKPYVRGTWIIMGTSHHTASPLYPSRPVSNERVSGEKGEQIQEKKRKG